jgi:hypothetical protein
MSQTIKIFSAGLSEQDNMAVVTAAKLLSYENINYKISANNLKHAHLLIIDEENHIGKQALRQCRPGQVKLVVSNKPMMAKNIIGLQRPVNLSTLKNVLNKLYKKLNFQLTSLHTDDSTSTKNTRVTELKESIFNVLLETKQKKQILHIVSDGIPDIFIDGCNQCLATSASDSELEKLIILPIEQIGFYKLKPKSFAVHSNEMNIQSLHNLLWLSAIKCSRGKILAGHNLEKPIRLKAWPNFTRTTFIAEHLKLAAILAKQPNTIRQLSDRTGIALNEVINFYNAAYAVDLIDFGNDPDKSTQELRTRSTEQQGLFAKIAERLSLKGIF